jgi:citrate synthase
MKETQPTTEISTFDEHGIYIRGKSLVDDLIGEVSFTEMIYFHILGRMPSDGERRILDAVLVTLVDHGVLGAVGARMTYMGAPDFIQGAVATGILGMGNQFGGVMEQVGEHLSRLVEAADPEREAREIVRRYRSAGRPVPGFGHPHHRPEDPRTPKLLGVAERAGVPGKHIRALRLLARVVDDEVGRHLTINATAGMAALLAEIGVPWRIMRGFALISRAPGIVGHIYEEQQRPAAYFIGMMAQEKVPYTGTIPGREAATSGAPGAK